ncbi:MAG: hypothetical protein FWG17_03050 [Desulfovibrionaceae bacterium]|nr:hypothetical protein [Desulfovibrionaceae bacterium]
MRNPRRALIRHAVVCVLKEDAGLAALTGGRVFPNREEHWLAGELPAIGVYALSEEVLDTDISPDPRERRISLIVEALVRMAEKADDKLDELAWAVEMALAALGPVGAAMTALVNKALAAAGKDPLPPATINGIPRSSAVDTLLSLTLKSTELGIAVDGNRQIGVAVLNFDLDYALSDFPPALPDFLLAASAWDVVPADGKADMESRVEFDPSTKE